MTYPPVNKAIYGKLAMGWTCQFVPVNLGDEAAAVTHNKYNYTNEPTCPGYLKFVQKIAYKGKLLLYIIHILEVFFYCILLS